MERETVIKALEICSNYKGCSDCKSCPLHNDEYVQCEQNVLEGLALSLIKELTEEAENYKKVAEKQQSLSMERHFEIKRLTEENERLKAIPEQLHKEMSERMIEERRIERKLAVKKMQERLKDTPIKVGLPLFGLQTKGEVENYANEIILQMRDAIDQIAKEMLEGIK